MTWYILFKSLKVRNIRMWDLNPRPPFFEKGALSAKLIRYENTKRSLEAPLLAQGEGFEPSWLLAKRFSRPPRYDRFDTPANIYASLSLRIYICRECIEVALKTRFENPLRMQGQSHR